MGKLLMFSDIERIAKSQNDDVVLFGERDMVDDGTQVYDLIYHGLSGLKSVYDSLKPSGLVIPIIKGDSITADVHPYLANLAKENPGFTRFGVLDEILSKLSFYDVHFHKIGKHVEFKKYFVVDRDKFYERHENPSLERRKFKELVKMIEESY
jgi:hypothetical protein